MQIRKQDFLNYCIKKTRKLNQSEQVPDREERASLQTILDVFDKVFYKKEESSKRYDSDDSEQLMDNGFIPQFDGGVDLSFDSDESDRSIDKFVIPQFDGGNDSESSQEEKIIEKSVFAINCENQEITTLLNFFRNCDFLWKSMSNHSLCQFDQKDSESNCFFCNMRSSCLRLNSPRAKGPKSLKLVEFTSQMFHYENQGWNWREKCDEINHFIGNTLKLLKRNENHILSFLGFPSGHCNQCQMQFALKSKYIYEVQTKNTEIVSNKTTIKEILQQFLISNGSKKCCMEFMKLENKQMKYVIFEFSSPIDININTSETLWGKRIEYKSHIAQINHEADGSKLTFFKHGDEVLYQDTNGDVCQSTVKVHKNVILLALIISDCQDD